MSKKFITTEETRVVLTHYMPFDSVNGMGKTEVELSQMGYLVDNIPEPEQIEGKIPEAHYSPEKGFWYEYIDQPQSQNMTLAQSVEAGVITPEQFEQITGVKYGVA